MQQDYTFVSNIRFLAITAIVLTHSMFFELINWDSPLLVVLAQVIKFGSINFFLISGFLLGERLDRQSSATYLRNRLRTIFTPWLLWAALLTLLFIARDVASTGLTLRQLHANTLETLFYSSYWFIPNYFLALGLLLALRRYVRRWWLGLALALVTSAYGLNLYGHWLPVDHTVALFAFVFYLWLGTFIQAHFTRVRQVLAAIPWPVMLTVLLATGAAALWESRVLAAGGHHDVLNILRLSNQLYSLVVFAVLLRVRRPLWPRWLDVRMHVFGLFLVHWLVMILVHKVFLRAGASVLGTDSGRFKQALAAHLDRPAEQLLTWAALAAGVYGLTFLLVRFLAGSPRFGWTVGAGVLRRPSRPVPLAVKAVNADD